MGWLDDLSPEARSEWDDFVEHFRRDAAEKIAGSEGFISIFPSGGKIDVKFAVELGAAIMLDKPILAIVPLGTKIPRKFRLIADEIIEADLDTTSGQILIAGRVREFLDRMKKENGE